MKQGWELKQLGDVCKVFNGSTPLRRKKEYWEDGEINWFTVDDIREQGRKISFTKQRISKLGFENSSLKILPPKSILLCCTASVGEYAMNEVELTTNQQFNGIVINDKDFLIPEFLFHFSSTLKNLLLEISGKTTIDFVSMTKVRAIPKPNPPHDEQKRIVIKLDECFEAIDKARANVEKNLNNAKELFQSQLNQIFSQKGDGWVETTIGQIVNESIIEKPLDGNHGEIHPKKSDFVSSGIPFIMASDLQNGGVNTFDCNFITKEQAESLRKGFSKNGDVLLSHKGTIGRTAIHNSKYDYIVLTPQVTYYRVIDSKTLFNQYIYYFFHSPIFLNEMINYAKIGTTRAYIGITKQLQLNFTYPSLEYQKQIVNQLDGLKSQTKSLESNYQQELDALDELKKSLLQKAFLGQLIMDNG